jgi:hypothetical protein
VSTVALPRWVVGVLVGLCAVSVLAVAFLLGRASARVPTGTATGGNTTGPAQAAGMSSAPRAPSTEPPEAGEASDPRLASGPATGTEPAAGGRLDAAAVAAYFRQMDAIGAEAKAGQDPQSLARTVLDQALSGNMGGIEGLIATQRSLEVRLQQIQPPPSCSEYHRRSVRLFARATALLERVRDATTGAGGPDLAGVAVEGRAVEEEARAVDALANDLRRAAGLAPVS